MSISSKNTVTKEDGFPFCESREAAQHANGSPIYELFCAQMEKNWGIEAWGIRPRIAACEPNVMHFATTIPPSDDVVDYVAKRGFGATDDFELFKGPQARMGGATARCTLSRC